MSAEPRVVVHAADGPVRLARARMTLTTKGRGCYEITAAVEGVVRDSGMREGRVDLFIRHTSASLLVTENADPTVRADLERWLADAVPDGDPRFRHDAEGPDDMPAHVRAALTNVDLCLPVVDGRLGLGRWQGIFVYEHRRDPHPRELLLTLIGC